MPKRLAMNTNACSVQHRLHGIGLHAYDTVFITFDLLNYCI